MAARQLRWGLLLELAGYVFLGAWLSGKPGWNPLSAVLLGAGLFLGFRALVVAVSFVFTAASGPAPAGGLAWLRMALEEYAGLLVLFVVIMPFEPFWMGADRLRPSGEKDRMPLLLVHGYQCNRGFWFWLRRRLEAAGWMVATHNLEPVLADIDAYAPALDKRIDEVLAATGARQVILVGHSMGGLASRAYLRRYGHGKVARMISLGSPHHGSRLAALGWGPNGRQMHFRGPWVTALAATGLPAGSVSIYSLHDNQVMPQRECSELAGAKNVAVTGVSHLGMAFSPAFAATLIEELGEPAAG